MKVEKLLDPSPVEHDKNNNPVGSKNNDESIENKILRFANGLTFERKHTPRSRERETRRFGYSFRTQ